MVLSEKKVRFALRDFHAMEKKESNSSAEILEQLGIYSGFLRREAMLLAYAVRHGYDLEFSGDGRITNIESLNCEGWFRGALQELIAEADEEQSVRLRNLYGRLKEIPTERYRKDIYQNFLISRERRYAVTEDDAAIASLLQEMGIRSVIDAGGHFPSIMGALDKEISYSVYEEKRREWEFRLAEEALGREDAAVYFVNRETGERDVPDGNFDALITIRDPRMEKGAIDWSIHNMWSEKKCRYSVLLVDLTEPHPEALEGNHLMRVAMVARDKPTRHILVFDMKESHDHIQFQDGRVVSYDAIFKMKGWINAPLYLPAEVTEGYEAVPLGELAEFKGSGIIATGGTGHGLKVPTYHLSASFAEVASPDFRPRVEAAQGMIWCGQHLHIGRSNEKYSSRLYAAISRSSGRYRCNCDMALVPNVEKVSIEYLAYALMNDRWFGNLFNLMPPRLLADYKVIIKQDLDDQRKIVADEMERLRDVVNSSGVYNVVLLNGGGVFSPASIRSMEKWGLNIQSNLSSVYGPSGMKELVSFALKEGAKIDAVLVDPSTDSKGSRLKGLQGAISFCRRINVPLFVYSALPINTIKEDLEEEDLSYCEDGNRLFSAEGEFALKSFVTAVRDDLDKNGTLSRQLRQRFKKEFEAAEIVEASYGPTTMVLETALINPNKSLNEVRISMDRCLSGIARKISSGSGLEKVDTGLLPALFRDTVVEDSMGNRKGVYTLTGRIMGKTLAASLVYMFQILNGASHGDEDESGNKLNVQTYMAGTRTMNIAMSAIHIYMEFLVWLAQKGTEFDVKCSFRDPAAVAISCTGTVHRVNAKEYYVETENYPKIHIGPQQQIQLREGMQVFIKTIYPEKGADFVRKYDWFTKDIRALAASEPDEL